LPGTHHVRPYPQPPLWASDTTPAQQSQPSLPLAQQSQARPLVHSAPALTSCPPHTPNPLMRSLTCGKLVSIIHVPLLLSSSVCLIPKRQPLSYPIHPLPMENAPPRHAIRWGPYRQPTIQIEPRLIFSPIITDEVHVPGLTNREWLQLQSTRDPHMVDNENSCQQRLVFPMSVISP
jgi:hypothetical protein